MKNIWKISLILLIIVTFQSCGSDTQNTNTDAETTLSASGEILEMESSNEGGWNASGELLNDSFR